MVYDPVGGEIGTQALNAVARLGRFAVIGYASGSWPRIDPLQLLLGNYSVVGVFGGNFTHEEDAAALDRLCELAEQGVIRTPIGRVYTFDQAPAAIHDVAEGGTIGKTVVRAP